MSDILSSASLLLAILTTVFGLVYPTLKEILDLKVATHKADNRANYKKALIIRKTRLLPLLLGSVILTLVFIPELIKQLVNTYHIITEKGFHFKDYDTVIASFIVVSLFMIVLTIAIVIITIEFFKKTKALNPN